jgi:quercetin dioxygenase-like cupin family protein
MMNRKYVPFRWVLAALAVMLLSHAGLAADSLQTEKPYVKSLPTDTRHYTLLAETEGFESGCVTRLPGTSGHEHSTKSWREMLIVLKGEGEVIIGGGEPLAIRAGSVAYIPPNTIHQIHCTSDVPLQYVYVAVKGR